MPGRPLSLHFLAVVIGCFVLYSANQRELGLADTIPATLLPASLLRDGDLALDEFEPMFDEVSPDGASTLRKQLEWTLAIRRVNGKLRSSYPVGAALLATPVYVLPVAFGRLEHFDDYRAVGKTAAALVAALSAGFVFLILRRSVSLRVAWFLTAAYSLGTTVWVIASQALWQHGPALLCLSVAIWAALRLAESGARPDAALVSAGAALAIVCRPQDAIAAAPLLAFALVSRPKAWPLLAAPGAVILAWQAAYNWSAFGSVGGGYTELYHAPAHAFRHLDARTAFTLPLHEGLAGLLFSPGKGLLFYTPLSVAGLIALPLLSLRPGARLPRALLFWTLGTLYVLAKNRLWWGGTSYGPRYLTELALPLTVSLGLVWERLSRRKALVVAVAAAGAYGVAVQALGAVTWECGWHHYPGWVDFVPERVWDYGDPEILRCAQGLSAHGPKPPEFGPFAR